MLGPPFKRECGEAGRARARTEAALHVEGVEYVLLQDQRGTAIESINQNQVVHQNQSIIYYQYNWRLTPTYEVALIPYFMWAGGRGVESNNVIMYNHCPYRTGVHMLHRCENSMKCTTSKLASATSIDVPAQRVRRPGVQPLSCEAGLC